MTVKFICSHVEDGNMSEKWEPGIGKKNTEAFLIKYGVTPENTLALNIQDKNTIAEYDLSIVQKEPYGIFNIKADAIITRKKDLFVYSAFGDCVPFTIHDRKQDILVFAHLGLASAMQDLHIKVIHELMNKYGSKVENLHCYLGPSIKKESYIKKIDDIEIQHEWTDFIEKQDNLFAIDLQGYIVHCLKKLNIENISISDIDTGKDEHYFSHYRSKRNLNYKEGRFIYGAMMVDE